MGTKRPQSRSTAAAISHINTHGALLVFPINNRELPNSLWTEFFPKTKMVWEWNEDSDYKVADTWQLMKTLSVRIPGKSTSDSASKHPAIPGKASSESERSDAGVIRISEVDDIGQIETVFCSVIPLS
jgi:hypothetical protein